MTTKIVVIVRTRDEAHRIAQFCKSYEDADLIIVGDGGSIDNTKEIAEGFPNTLVVDFPGRTKMLAGHWRNNDSDHVNWLIERANEQEPDWIFWDDCDCRPNYLAKQDYRKIVEETDKDFLMITRLYLWGLGMHFPDMAGAGASLWAWRTTQDFWTVDVPPAFTFRVGDVPVGNLEKQFSVKILEYPYCLMHFSWDDSERVKLKVQFYKESGLIPGQLHPLNFAGVLDVLPHFAHE